MASLSDCLSCVYACVQQHTLCVRASGQYENLTAYRKLEGGARKWMRLTTTHQQWGCRAGHTSNSAAALITRANHWPAVCVFQLAALMQEIPFSLSRRSSSGVSPLYLYSQLHLYLWCLALLFVCVRACACLSSSSRFGSFFFSLRSLVSA